MLIKIFNAKFDSNKLNCNYKKQKRLVVIIPKKSVKLANKRNKIRRQIRAIMQGIGQVNRGIVVKYIDINTTPDFQELKKTVLTNLSINKII